MWILTSKKSGIIYYLLPEKQKHTVGRSSADLIIKDDSSISRSHACIFLANDYVKIIDVGSRYGTYYNENIENEIKMEVNKEVILKNGERVQFGLMGNEWTLSKLNINSLISTLSSKQQNKLQEILKALGGNMTGIWMDSCTHLTMSHITVTLKVLRALVENIPIVSCEYWEVYYKNMREGKRPPKCEEYLPELAERFFGEETVSFGLNDARKTIFQGKTFLFTDEQLFDKYKPIINRAGGTCENLGKSIQKSLLVRKDVIVIQSTLSSQSQSSQITNPIEGHLTSKGRRLIPEFEIGLAIIHCSTEKYCNPENNLKFTIIRSSHSSLLDKNIDNGLAEQTPFDKEGDGSIGGKCENSDILVEIPESMVCSEDKTHPQSQSSSQVRNDMESENFIDIEEQNIPKDKPDIFVMNEDSNIMNKNMKRKHSLVEEDEQVKKKANCSKENLPKPKINTQMFDLNEFLDTHKIQSAKEKDDKNNANENDPSVQAQNSRKRGKLAIIGDEDDDNDNLFNFGSVLKKLKKSQTNDNEDNGDDLFNFKNKNNHSPSISKNVGGKGTSKVVKKPSRPHQYVVSKDTIQIDKRVKKLIEISSDGWLSTSMNKIKIKSENESPIKQKPDETVPDWIQSLKGGFEVRVKPMQLVSRSFSRDASVDESSEAMNTTKKNFKAFVKKQTYKSQKTVIPTVPFYCNT